MNRLASAIAIIGFALIPCKAAGAESVRTVSVDAPASAGIEILQSHLALVGASLGTRWQVVEPGEGAYRLRFFLGRENDQQFVMGALWESEHQRGILRRYYDGSSAELENAVATLAVRLVADFERELRKKTGVFVMGYPEESMIRVVGEHSLRVNGFVPLDPGIYFIELVHPERVTQLREVVVEANDFSVIEIFLKRPMGPQVPGPERNWETVIAEATSRPARTGITKVGLAGLAIWWGRQKRTETFAPAPSGVTTGTTSTPPMR